MVAGFDAFGVLVLGDGALMLWDWESPWLVLCGWFFFFFWVACGNFFWERVVCGAIERTYRLFELDLCYWFQSHNFTSLFQKKNHHISVSVTWTDCPTIALGCIYDRFWGKICFTSSDHLHECCAEFLISPYVNNLSPVSKHLLYLPAWVITYKLFSKAIFLSFQLKLNLINTF
jgi:hypothetical protein